MKSIQKNTHVKEFTGQTLGVDAYGWLHRGTVSCAIELAEGRPTRKHIDFTLHRVRMLIHFGVKPYMVFDGDYLPSKAHTESLRAAKRKESKRVGLDLLRMGKTSQAHLELQKAIDVTPLMARELIEELKRLDVPYVVAPYEADSQLAYLEKQGVISGVISEDSDLLVFGVKRLLTKLDQYGDCIMVDRADFTACRDISLVGWSDKEFRMMAMLSGCDYLPGLEKMGLKTAYRLVRKHKVVERVVQTVQFDGKMRVPAGYLEAFIKAERTFMHQWVFCPQRRCLVNLCQLPADLSPEALPYIGKCDDPEMAAGVACGDLDPNTKQPLVLPRTFQSSSVRSRMVQTPLGKNGKPISEFFKANRTPLAELDPNSLTPSPSQQRLLQAATNVSWSASGITNARSATGDDSPSTNTPLSTLQGVRRTASDPRPNVREVFPKRQRLCNDSSIAAAMDRGQSVQTMTSRFFTKIVAEITPTQRKKSTRKNEDFDLWSDDSVAEAMASVTADSEAVQDTVVATPRKKKKLEIYTDEQTCSTARDVGIDAHETATITSTPEPREARIAATPASSLKSKRSFSTHRNLGEDTASGASPLKRRTSSSPRKSVPRTKSAPSALTADQKTSDKTTALGRFALQHQSKTEDETDELQNSCRTKTPSSADEDPLPADEAVVDDDEWLAIEKMPADTNDQYLFKGSEDLLVPNSPDDADSNNGTNLKLNLGKFVFVD